MHYLFFTAYAEKLEEYIPTSYKIRYIFEELYVAGYVNYKLAYKLYWLDESSPRRKTLTLEKIKVGWVLWCIKVQICKQSYCELMHSCLLLLIWTLLYHNTQPVSIFSRVRIFHLERLEKVTWLHSFGILWVLQRPKTNTDTTIFFKNRTKYSWSRAWGEIELLSIAHAIPICGG